MSSGRTREEGKEGGGGEEEEGEKRNLEVLSVEEGRVGGEE